MAITLLQVIMFAASMVIQQVQARKIREAQQRAKDAAAGFQLVRDGEALPISVIYGRAKIGGIRVYHNTFSNYKGPDSFGAAYPANVINYKAEPGRGQIFTSKNPIMLVIPVNSTAVGGKVRAYFAGPPGLNPAKISDTEGVRSVPIIVSIIRETNGANGFDGFGPGAFS